MAGAENLTIMFVDMAGFTERTARQSREQNKALLRDFSGLLVPLIARFGGKRIKTIGDAFLVTFRSPTDGVRCSMAMMDAVAEYNLSRQDDPLRIRVALNTGEVRVENNDVFGEAVNIAARVEELTPPGEIYLTGVVYLSMNKAEVASEHVGERALKGMPEKVRLFRVPSHKITRLTAAGEPASGPGDLPYGGMHVMSPDAHVFMRLNDAMMRARYTDWRAKARGIPPRQAAIGGAGIAALAVFGAAAIWLLTGDRFEQIGASGNALPAIVKASEISEGAREALRKGNTAYFERRRNEAAQLYAKALEMAPQLRHDSGLAANLVGTLGWAGELPAETIRKYPGPEFVFELGRRTGAPGRRGAQRAAALLTELGQSARIDQYGLAVTDLNEGPACEDRLAAVKRLRDLKDARALPLLKQYVRTSFAGFVGGMFSKDKNACLRDEAKATIAELEKLNPPAAPPS